MKKFLDEEPNQVKAAILPSETQPDQGTQSSKKFRKDDTLKLAKDVSATSIVNSMQTDGIHNQKV